MSTSLRSALTVRARITLSNRSFIFSSAIGSSGLWGSESVSRNFSSLCLAISSTSAENVPSAKNIFRLRYTMYFCRYSATASVLQKYFIPSGIVMRACSQIRKKLSIVVRLVKMTALCSNISTR